VDREIEELKRDLVIVNNKKGSYEMVNFLVGNGHKNIVALMGPEHVRTAQKRFDAIFAGNDLIAIGAIQLLEEKVIGFLMIFPWLDLMIFTSAD
jgi:DNA-binding LacI/PurR family transcriptional regulator